MEKVRCDILSQINAKEVERIEERKTSFEDGLTLKQENLKREREMAEAMIDKIQNLRNYKMPEKYVKDLERKLKLEQYIKDMERLKRGEMLKEESVKGQSTPYERLAQRKFNIQLYLIFYSINQCYPTFFVPCPTKLF